MTLSKNPQYSNENKWLKYVFQKNLPQNLLTNTPCPLCNSNTFKKMYPKIYPRLVQCQKCNLIYTNPRLKNQYLRKLYSSDYYNNNISDIVGYQNYQVDELQIRQTFKKRLTNINSLCKHGELLDIGCAMGFFMDEAKKQNWQVSGIDISKYAANHAKKSLGLHVDISSLQQTTLPQNKFDLITMWDVIEHLPNPKTALVKLHSALKKNGLLVFSTPNVGSLPAMVTKSKWIGYKLSDEHLTYFSSLTINKLCRDSGFKIIKMHSIGKYVSFSLFANRLHIYNKQLGTVASLINKLVPKNFFFYINPLDIICVYAKKI